MKRHSTRGFTLLEAMVAMLVLSVAGVALVEAASQALRAEVRTAREEQEVADLDRLLTAYSLLGHRDLERHIGTEMVGPYRVRVERTAIGLYSVGVGSDAQATDLVTVLYRPAEALP